MFEQSVVSYNRSRRPGMFLLATATELLVLAAAVILPLFWIGGPTVPKLPALLRLKPRSMPIEAVPVERVERSMPKPSPFRYFVLPREPSIATRPLSPGSDISNDSAPEIGADPTANGDVPFAVANSTAVKRPLPPPDPPKPPAAKEPPAPIHVSQGVQEAKLIHRVMPVYPHLAVQTRQFGTVRLVAVIGKDGHMRDVQVLSGPAFLVEAAREAVKQWVYRPTLLNGAPVEVVAPITVNFTLSQ